MYNTLYKRNTNGSIQQWRVEVVVDAYRTISGKYNSDAQVVSALTVCKGKNLGKANATTSREQCLLEVAALYKKKLERGYVEDIRLLDKNEIGLLNPMLAKEYVKYKDKVKFPVISSLKADGVRNNALESGLYSRNGKPFVSCPHILEALKPAFEKYPEYVFDGELFNFELKHEFNTIISLVKKGKPTEDDLTKSKKLIRFYIFDIFRKDGKETLKAIQRKELIETIVAELASPVIKSLGYKVCNNQTELDAAYQEYLSDGAEGQMINDYNALYSHKRDSCLLKRKEFKDAEFEVVDIISGKGNREGSAVLVLKSGDQTFTSALNGTVEYMQEIYRNRSSYLGKSAIVKFQDFTEKNADGTGYLPRFPVVIGFRTYE